MCEKADMGGFGGETGNVLPQNESQIRHIFGNRPGHLNDTPQNRQKLVELANSENHRLGVDKYGNAWYARMESDGSQMWVSVRAGIIQEGGRNAVPRLWDSETGFNHNPKKNPFKKNRS